MPASGRRDLAQACRAAGAAPRRRRRARRTAASRDQLGHRLHRRHAGVVAGASSATQASRSRVAERRAQVGADLGLARVVGLERDPALEPERLAQVRPEGGLDRADREPAAVARGVGVVAGVATGQDVVAGPDRLAASPGAGRPRATSARARRRPPRRRGTRPRPCARAAAAPPGSRSPRACRRPRCRRCVAPGSGGPPSRAAPEQSRKPDTAR